MLLTNKTLSRRRDKYDRRCVPGSIKLSSCHYFLVIHSEERVALPRTLKYIERIIRFFSRTFKYIGRPLSCGFTLDSTSTDLYSTYLWYIEVPLLDELYPILSEPIDCPYTVIHREQHSEILLAHIWIVYYFKCIAIYSVLTHLLVVPCLLSLCYWVINVFVTITLRS